MDTKKVKRRDPIAIDLLLSGTYYQRKSSNKKNVKRKFKNAKQFELYHNA
jgi:hypothetical protein